MMKTFVDDVPIELEESALIDGCSKWRAFFRITLPLTAPGITAVAIFVAVGIWNEYTFAYILSASRAVTAPVVITTVRSDVMGVNWGGLFAACVIQLLPMLILVIVVHKYLIRGIQTGAIK
jgi:multiple sugar transport system permease protein